MIKLGLQTSLQEQKEDREDGKRRGGRGDEKTKGEINPEFKCFKNACEVTDASHGGSICVYVNSSLVC